MIAASACGTSRLVSTHLRDPHRFRVVPAAGGGVVVEIDLPLARDTGDERHAMPVAAAPEMHARERAPVMRPPARVVVVDDEKPARRRLVELLDREPPWSSRACAGRARGVRAVRGARAPASPPT